MRCLGAIGGKDVADTTRRIMRSLMTNGVARRMNFAGRGSKTGISEMRILDIVIGRKQFHFFADSQMYKFIVCFYSTATQYRDHCL